MSTISSIDAKVAQSNIGVASEMVSSSVSNLVSGKKKNASVADFSVGTILRSKVGILRTALLNAGQAKSLLNTAKGALDTILESLNKQKNLAVKSADDSLSDNERAFLDQEFQALATEIDRIATRAEFNGKALIDGSISGEAGAKTATGLATENYGVISAGDIDLSGTVLTGNLSSTASKRGSNKLTIGSLTASTPTATVFTVTDDTGGNAAAISFTSGTTVTATATALVTAFNAFTGTNAKVAQNFRMIDNGNGSITIEAKEAGNYLEDYEFEFTTDGDIATATLFGDAAAGSGNVLAGAIKFSNEIDIGTTGNTVAARADDDARGINGTFGTIQAFNVGDARGTSLLTLTTAVNSGAVTLTITDTDGKTDGVAAGETVTISYTADANATVAEAVNDIIDIIDGGNGVTAADGAIAGTAGTARTGAATAEARLALLRNFVFERVGAAADGNINITAATAGTSMDDFTFNFTTSTGLTVATLHGDDVTNASVAFAEASTMVKQSSNRSTTVTEATVNTSLLGAITDFKATFNEALTNSQNSVTFSATVNGTTYVSEDVYLFGGSGGSALAAQGDTISSRQQIIFYDPNGPKTTNGDLTDNAFYLRMGGTAVTLADMSDSAKAQASVTAIADAFESQLASARITQNRTLDVDQISEGTGDHRVTSTVGTILEGLKGFDSQGDSSADYNRGDVRLITDGYSATGTFGSIESFTVNRLTNEITTTVNGETYTAYLSSSNLPTQGNVKAFGTNLDGTSNFGAYDSTSKILTLEDGTSSSATATVTGTAKLHFFSSDTTDGKILEIDLGNVSNNVSLINISTTEGESALANALNAAFGVAASDSLTFQVGSASDDQVGLSIGSAKTADIYLDSSGTKQVLDVKTKGAAKTAGDVISVAINTVISLISDIDAAISTFDSAISNNEISLQNADASRSNLLDTDYSEESTTFAESRVRVDAALSVLAQVNQRIQNLLQLLNQ